MNKRNIFIVSFIIGVIAVAIYFYDIIYLISGKDIRFRAVPVHTAFFTDVSQWEQIQQHATEAGYSETISRLNILLKVKETEQVLLQLKEKDNLILSDLKSGHLIFSYHVTKPGYLESLMILELDQADESILKDMMQNQTKFRTDKRMVRSEPVWDISMGDATMRWTITQSHGLLLMSKDPALVEDGLLQLKDNISVFKDGTFKALDNSNKAYVNVYYHLTNMSSAAQAYADKAAYIYCQSLSRFADWMALNLTLSNKGVALNGYCTTSQKELRLLNDYSFDNIQKNQSLYQKPDNTALLLSAVIHQSDANEKPDTIPLLKSKNYKKFMAPWFDEEASYILTEPVGKQYDAYSLLFLKSKLNSNPLNALKPLMLATDDQGNTLPQNYKGYRIGKLNKAGWYSMILPNPFVEFTSPYVVITKDYVVLAESLTQIKLYIERLIDNKTLDKTLAVDIDSKWQNNSNYTVYSSLPLLNDFVSNSLGRDYADAFMSEYNLFSAWSPLLLNFKFESKGLFQVTGVLLSNPKSTEVHSAYLWKTELDTTAISSAYVVWDEVQREKRILVQDAALNLYMFNRAGDVLWRNKLEAPLTGGISNIDFYNSNKKQIVFATENKIYVMDDQGNHLPNFPITIPSRAIAQLSVIDPDGNNNYLYFVGCENGYVYGYEKGGRPLSGWNPNPDGKNVTLPVSYFRHNGKEFFMLTTNYGALRFYSRNGKPLYEELTTGAMLKRPFISIPGKGYVTADAFGDTYFLNYEGKINKGNSPMDDCTDAIITMFTSKDFADLICVNTGRIAVYRYDSSEVLSYTFKNALTSPKCNVLNGSESQRCILIEDQDNILPISTTGKSARHFPKKGIGLFAITDLYNNGRDVLVGFTDEQTLIAYPIDWED